MSTFWDQMIALIPKDRPERIRILIDFDELVQQSKICEFSQALFSQGYVIDHVENDDFLWYRRQWVSNLLGDKRVVEFVNMRE